MKHKTKFKSAEAKRLSEQLAADWDNLKRKYETPKPAKKVFTKQWSYELSTPPGRNTSHHIPSRSDGHGAATVRPRMTYTGTEMLGISIIHKSCLQPVFNQQAAVDAASMRR